MIRNLVTKTVIAGAVATCVAVVGITGAAQAGELTSAGPAGAVQTSLITTPSPDSASGLSVEVYKKDAAMSHRQLDYKITNTSNEAKTLEGWPDAASVLPGQIYRVIGGDTYFTKNTEATPITLQPGESAYGEIAWTAGGSTGPTPFELQATWSDGSGVDLDLGAVNTVPGGGTDTYTATNLHTQPLQ